MHTPLEQRERGVYFCSRHGHDSLFWPNIYACKTCIPQIFILYTMHTLFWNAKWDTRTTNEKDALYEYTNICRLHHVDHDDDDARDRTSGSLSRFNDCTVAIICNNINMAFGIRIKRLVIIIIIILWMKQVQWLTDRCMHISTECSHRRGKAKCAHICGMNRLLWLPQAAQTHEKTFETNERAKKNEKSQNVTDLTKKILFSVLFSSSYLLLLFFFLSASRILWLLLLLVKWKFMVRRTPFVRFVGQSLWFFFVL